MNQFSTLIENVEEEGGRYTEDVCKPQQYDVTGDDKKAAQAPFYLADNTCGQQAIFEVPYEQTDNLGRPTGVAPIRLCAVDDMMGLMPRFKVEGLRS